MANPTYGEFKFPGTFGFSGSDGKQMVRGYARGGPKKKTMAKVGKVMQEFAEGELHSGSKTGPVVTNPKQALAIGYSEARRAGKKPVKKFEGGDVSAEESMQGRLPRNAAMAAREQAGRMPRFVDASITEGERKRIAEGKSQPQTKKPVDLSLTEGERKKLMKKQVGGQVARDPREAEVKAAQMQMAAQEHARQIRGETERQLREGSADRARERVMADMEKRGAVARRKDGGMTKALQKHADLPASKAHKGLKYGGKAVPTHKSTPKIS